MSEVTLVGITTAASIITVLISRIRFIWRPCSEDQEKVPIRLHGQSARSGDPRNLRRGKWWGLRRTTRAPGERVRSTTPVRGRRDTRGRPHAASHTDRSPAGKRRPEEPAGAVARPRAVRRHPTHHEALSCAGAGQRSCVQSRAHMPSTVSLNEVSVQPPYFGFT